MTNNRFDSDDFGVDVPVGLAGLVDALEEHMADRDPLLPTPAMVALYPNDGMIGIAPQGIDLVVQLFGVLMWTYTMDSPGVSWCRRADGTFAVATEGRTRNGTAITAAGGGQYSECLGLLSLPVGKAQHVSVDTFGAFWDEIYAVDQAGRAESAKGSS